jgi:hypothetical protein
VRLKNIRGLRLQVSGVADTLAVLSLPGVPCDVRGGFSTTFFLAPQSIVRLQREEKEALSQHSSYRGSMLAAARSARYQNTARDPSTTIEGQPEFDTKRRQWIPRHFSRLGLEVLFLERALEQRERERVNIFNLPSTAHTRRISATMLSCTTLYQDRLPYHLESSQ